MIGQVGEKAFLDHAVDAVEIDVAIQVEVAKLARPRPAGAVDAPIRRLIPVATVGAAHQQHILHDLRVGGDLRLHHAHHHCVHHCRPAAHCLAGVGLHVGGENLKNTVVVEVGLVVAHRAVCHRHEAVAGVLPAGGGAHPGHVRRVEVVADQDVGAPVGVEVGEEDRQRLRGGGERRHAEASTQVFVQENAALCVADDVLVAAVGEQTGVVASDHQVEIALAIEVGPVGHVGRRGDARQHAALKLARTHILEIVERAGVARQHDIGAPVGVGIDDLDIARLAGGERFFAKGERAVVPENGVVAIMVADHQIEVAVAIEITCGQPGAVGLEHLHQVACDLRDVIQRVRDEAVAAGRGRSQRRARGGDRRVGARLSEYALHWRQRRRHNQQARHPLPPMLAAVGDRPPVVTENVVHTTPNALHNRLRTKYTHRVYHS